VAGWKIVSKREMPVAPAPESGAGGGSRAARIVRDQETTEPVRRARPTHLVAWICLLIVWVVWGSTYLAIRVGVETMPPLLMAAARNLVAGLIMFPLALRSRRTAASPARLRGALLRRLPSSLVPHSSVQAAQRPYGSPVRADRVDPRSKGSKGSGRFWPSRAEWLGCAIVGILLLVANGVVGVGERTVPSGLAALLVATVPLWLLGIDAGLNHARLGLAPMAGLALGLVGVALLSGLGGNSRGTSVVGVVIILGAAAMWALGTIMAGRVTLPSSPALASGMQLLAGGAVLLALGAATGEFGSLRLAEVSARSWLALGYLIVMGSIVAFSAYGIAVRALPTATVATYAYVNPVIAVLLGALILNEQLTPAMIGGGVLIVGAVVLVVRRSPPAH
jgi:drug/metabolite transporter (DMT)-like permease